LSSGVKDKAPANHHLLGQQEDRRERRARPPPGTYRE
jgi:hypothetical protein